MAASPIPHVFEPHPRDQACQTVLAFVSELYLGLGAYQTFCIHLLIEFEPLLMAVLFKI